MKQTTKAYTMTRKDWGSVLEGTDRIRANQAVHDRITDTLGRWPAKETKKLTINLTDKEVSSLLNAKGNRGGGYKHGLYLNTRQVYQQVARIYKAFGLPAPYEHLPHDVLKVLKPKKGDGIPEIVNGTFVPHTKTGKRAYTRWVGTTGKKAA